MNESNKTILLVDDDDVFRRTATRALQRRGFTVHSANSGEAALELPELGECESAVVDLKMPGMDGLELVSRLVVEAPALPVIVLTGHGTINTAIDAIKNGAFHYLTKPCDIQELQLYLDRGVERFRMQSENRQLRSAIQRVQSGHGIIGESPVIKTLIDLIERVKDAEAPVLVLGESGTGKELVARALHDLGQRKAHPFIAVNCATVKPDLLENELFGHVAGAFPGATQSKDGLLAVANQGTLFIDEIADMNSEVQASLLRVIETGEYRPFGSTHLRTSDARIIAAANRDLASEVTAGRFREDLYYRLNVLSITTPPLRDHPDDIPQLVESYLDASTRIRKGVSFSPQALEALQQYRWPGNVGELFNVCERAVLLSNVDEISAESVEALLVGSAATTDSPKSSETTGTQTLEDVERDHIRTTLEAVGGNVSQAATRLNIDRRTLQRKMLRYGLREE